MREGEYTHTLTETDIWVEDGGRGGGGGGGSGCFSLQIRLLWIHVVYTTGQAVLIRFINRFLKLMSELVVCVLLDTSYNTHGSRGLGWTGTYRNLWRIQASLR